MDAVVTKKARNKMLKARAGDQALPKIVGMASVYSLIGITAVIFSPG